MRTELVTTLKRQATELLKDVERGEKAIEEGRTVTHAQARQRLSRWLK